MSAMGQAHGEQAPTLSHRQQPSQKAEAGSKPACPPPLVQALFSLLGHLRIKAGPHSRFSHQAFIIKKVPEHPGHTLQPSPQGSKPGPTLAGSASGVRVRSARGSPVT